MSQFAYGVLTGIALVVVVGFFVVLYLGRGGTTIRIGGGADRED